MAFCINCGQELAEGAKFCPICGKAVNSDTATQRKTVYDGELHKCPNCGELLDAFTSCCSVCGYELRGTKATNSVRELAQKLQELEMQRECSNGSIFSKVIENAALSAIDERKINLIESFPIPNSKEDILEIAVLAIGNVTPEAYDSVNGNNEKKQAISSAWLAKFEQAYQKGQIMCGDSTELHNLHTLYLKKCKLISKMKNKIWWLSIAVLVAVFGLLFLMSCGIF